MINKGLFIGLAVVFIAVALLVFGQLGTGAGSFWYGLNNPNTSAQNLSSGGPVGSVTVNSAITVIQATALPILVAVGVAAGLVIAVMKSMGVF